MNKRNKQQEIDNINKKIKISKKILKKTGEFEKTITKILDYHNEEGECECYGCKHGLDALFQKEQEFLSTVGWFAHYVQDNNAPNNINYHTHGLKENFKHTDFQITVPLRFKTAHGFFNLLIEKLREGRKFVAGVDYDDIAVGYVVRFTNAGEDGRKVLRMLIPNKQGTYEGPVYKAQFQKLNNE